MYGGRRAGCIVEEEDVFLLVGIQGFTKTVVGCASYVYITLDYNSPLLLLPTPRTPGVGGGSASTPNLNGDLTDCTVVGDFTFKANLNDDLVDEMSMPHHFSPPLLFLRKTTIFPSY